MNTTTPTTELAPAAPAQTGLAAVPAPATAALAVAHNSYHGDMLLDATAFAQLQRAGTMLANSGMVPKHLQGNVAGCCMAILYARQLGESELIVSQNMVSINGTAGWKATFLIARANKSGVFKGRIQYRLVGKGKDLVATAYATLADTGEEVSVDVSMQMAIADGWANNKKYQSIPEQMLRYRAASFLIRLYAPETMLGMSDDEIEDVQAARGPVANHTRVVVSQPAGSAAGIAESLGVAPPKDEVIDVADVGAVNAGSGEVVAAGGDDAATANDFDDDE